MRNSIGPAAKGSLTAQQSAAALFRCSLLPLCRSLQSLLLFSQSVSLRKNLLFFWNERKWLEDMPISVEKFVLKLNLTHGININNK